MSAEPPVPRRSRFLPLWTLAVAATAALLVTHVGLRHRALGLGYELGELHAQVARLAEVRRTLRLEVAALETPERVERIARALGGAREPSSSQLIAGGKMPGAPTSREPSRRAAPETAALEPSRAEPSAERLSSVSARAAVDEVP